jgi:hypothetical protein
MEMSAFGPKVTVKNVNFGIEEKVSKRPKSAGRRFARIMPSQSIRENEG